MAKPPGIGKADGIGQAQVDDVETLLRRGEEVSALVGDHPNFRQDVAGKIADDGAAERLEHGLVAFGDGDVLRSGMQRDLGRDAAAELGDEGLGRRLDDVWVDHRQETEIGRLLVGQIAHDADRTVAVDVQPEIGVGRHRRQVEAGVVGEPRARNEDRSSNRPRDSRTATSSRRPSSHRGISARRRRPCSR